MCILHSLPSALGTKCNVRRPSATLQLEVQSSNLPGELRTVVSIFTRRTDLRWRYAGTDIYRPRFLRRPIRNGVHANKSCRFYTVRAGRNQESSRRSDRDSDIRVGGIGEEVFHSDLVERTKHMLAPLRRVLEIPTRGD